MSDQDTIEYLANKVEYLARKVGALQAELTVAASKADSCMDFTTIGGKNAVMDLIAICLKSNRDEIAQIKQVRVITGLGLKEAKELVQEAWARANQVWDQPVVRNGSDDPW